MMLPQITTSDGFLLVLSIITPVAGMLTAFVLGGRFVKLVAYAVILIEAVIVLAILIVFPQNKGLIVYLLGSWSPPLGLALRADGLSAAMLATTTIVIGAVAAFAATDFPTTGNGSRGSFAFWILLLGIWSALNMIYLGGDLFTLYVALELLTFSAVPLVSLEGRAETLWAAMQYLLFALLGSVLYLLGTAILYGLHGTLDVVLISHHLRAEPAALLAVSLMTTGLLAKTALFPLHLWLPPAHAGAPSAASAILSGLVVKGSFFIIIRLWFNLIPDWSGFIATQLFGVLGGSALVFGSIVALRQERLKLLIAYSTIAQIGYLFLMFPLAIAASGRLESGDALAGGLLQTVSHATAKAAMFLAAGSIYATLGQDNLSELRGVWRRRPFSVLAFALSGFALMGLPPGGAYLAKELLLQVAIEQRQWWWSIVIEASGVFTGAYVILVLAHIIVPLSKELPAYDTTPRTRELTTLTLAICSLLLGLFPWEVYLPMTHNISLEKLSLETFSKAFPPLIGGVVVAILLGRWSIPIEHSSCWKTLLEAVRLFRRAALTSCNLIETCESILRQWSTACLYLLLLTVLFAVSMLVT